MNFLKANWVALVAMLIAIVACLPILPNHKSVFGSISTTCQGTTTCLGDLYITSKVSGATGILQTDGAAIIGGLATLSAGLLQTSTSATSTSATSQTLVPADVNGFSTVILTPTTASVTETLFASSTATTFLPTAGNSQTTCFINGTTTSAINITFAGGTGTKLQVASSSATALGSLNLAPQKEGCFTFTRANSTATTFDIIAAYTAFQ